MLPDCPPPQLLQICEECGSYLRVCLCRHIHLDSTHRRHHVSLQSHIACNAMSTRLPAAGVDVCLCCLCRWLSGLLHLCFRFTFIESMLYGAIISATDPVRSPPKLQCSAVHFLPAFSASDPSWWRCLRSSLVSARRADRRSQCCRSSSASTPTRTCMPWSLASLCSMTRYALHCPANSWKAMSDELVEVQRRRI